MRAVMSNEYAALPGGEQEQFIVERGGFADLACRGDVVPKRAQDISNAVRNIVIEKDAGQGQPCAAAFASTRASIWTGCRR